MDEIMEFLQNFGAMGLFIHAMLDAIIFPIPAFFLQLSLSAVQPESALWLATVGFAGSLLGTPIGYGIGKLWGKHVLGKKWLDSASDLFARRGEAAILIGSFTPIPFKIFSILSGCMNYTLWKLLSYAAIGRAVKFYVVGFLFYIYGRAAENMVNQVLTIMLVGIGIAIATIWFLIRKLSERRKIRDEHQPIEKTGNGGGKKDAVDKAN
ncbi:VTT domain-containing protein [Paenibacillus sp. CMAA1739]|uniref:YqaA family protein n=1 Tax=Paenibacillus ottowii TaxID=2315729 RepID=UPI00273180B4|nr:MULTISPECIES: VTT domain-containing protein [Paenibacillus]MDP1512076.1 VTT domain-containing protein [Paenibacillus ottowii]MEC4569048.1 VTT domain-containing protein [Paenibacillus sp. CMAA1739]